MPDASPDNDMLGSRFRPTTLRGWPLLTPMAMRAVAIRSPCRRAAIGMAAVALLALVARAEEPIPPLLQHRDADIRERALRIIHSERIDVPLDDVLRACDDPDESVRYSALHLLARYRDDPRREKAIERLRRELRVVDRRPASTMRIAVHTLEVLGEAAAAAAPDLQRLHAHSAWSEDLTWELMRPLIWRALCRLGYASVRELLIRHDFERW